MGDPPIFFGAVRAGDPPSNSHFHFSNGAARCPNSSTPAFTIFGCGLYLEPAQNRCGPEIKVRYPALEKTSMTWQPNFCFKGRAIRRLHSYPKRLFSKLFTLFGAGFCRDGPDLTIWSSFSPLFAERVSDWVAVAVIE